MIEVDLTLPSCIRRNGMKTALGYNTQTDTEGIHMRCRRKMTDILSLRFLSRRSANSHPVPSIPHFFNVPMTASGAYLGITYTMNELRTKKTRQYFKPWDRGAC
jgi:hypothetical protein